MKATDQLRWIIDNAATSRDYERRQSLLLQGDISRHLYMVESGCLRLWHNDNGRDITVQFFLKDMLVASIESFFMERPSRYGLEAIVPTTVKVIEKHTLNQQMGQNGNDKDALIEALVQRLADYQGLFLNRIMESPEQRYRHLFEQNPELFRNVPQHYIASFLGITAVSLSRIRKKVEAD